MASRRSTGSAQFGRAEIAAAGALVDYVALTQTSPRRGKAAPALIAAAPARRRADRSMEIDAATRRNLELTEKPRRASADGSLLAAIDRTLTGPGARLLAEHLAAR